MYRNLHEVNLRDFTEKYGRDLVRGFDYHYKRGKVEIMATAATHAYLPLYMQHPPAIRAQVQIGVETHASVFGKTARGFWLPELGYSPGLEDLGVTPTPLATVAPAWLVRFRRRGRFERRPEHVADLSA